MRVMCEDWTRLNASVQPQDRMGAEKSDSAIKWKKIGLVRNVLV